MASVVKREQSSAELQVNGLLQESEKKLEDTKAQHLAKLKEKDDELKRLKEQMKVDENTRIATQLAWKETKQHLIDQLTTLTVWPCSTVVFSRYFSLLLFLLFLAFAQNREAES